MPKTAFAIAAHPDDIEFFMSGTLMRLKNAGYEIHYMNLADGCCGSTKHSREEIARIRGTKGWKRLRASERSFTRASRMTWRFSTKKTSLRSWQRSFAKSHPDHSYAPAGGLHGGPHEYLSVDGHCGFYSRGAEFQDRSAARRHRRQSDDLTTANRMAMSIRWARRSRLACSSTSPISLSKRSICSAAIVARRTGWMRAKVWFVSGEDEATLRRGGRNVGP